MNSLKILSLFFALFLIGTNITFAQSERSNLTDEQKEELAEGIEEYFNSLNLSEEQKPVFEELTRKYAEQMKAVKDAGGRKFKMYRRVKSIRKEKNAEMEKLLSEDQYEVYLEKQEEMQERRNN